MKRLTALVALMLAVPVVADQMPGIDEHNPNSVEQFRQAAIERINHMYDLPEGYVAFEMTCYPDSEFGGGDEFFVNLSTSGPENVPIPTEVLKTLVHKNSYCILGPIDTELRKQQKIDGLNRLIEFIKLHPPENDPVPESQK